jgi:hypothetical protein
MHFLPLPKPTPDSLCDSLKPGYRGICITRVDMLLLVYTDQLSESLSDAVSEQRLSEDARSGLRRKEVKNVAILSPKNLFCKEALGNACLFWLPMLH